jgi:hypothetical protein
MKRRIVFTVVLVLLLLVGTGMALAAGGYDLSHWTVAGGGGASSGTGYSLSGAAGQPAAGELSGTGFHLSGGFWVGGGVAGPPGHDLYLPLILK